MSDSITSGAANGGSLDEEIDSIDEYPDWSKTLLLLLDYAIIEGAQHRFSIFVSLLEMARKELEEQAISARKREAKGN